jgi:hypothetical protein
MLNWFSFLSSKSNTEMSNNVRGRGGRGRGGRGRGRGGSQMTRDQHLAAIAALDNQATGPIQASGSNLCRDCNRTFGTPNGLAQHRASLHGAPIARKDGTQATARSSDTDRQRTAAYNAATRTETDLTSRFTLAPPLWVTNASQQNIRQDSSLKSRVTLLGNSDVYLHQLPTVTLGNGLGCTANLSTANVWRGNEVNGSSFDVPFPVFEFIGLDIGVFGEFGSHGDFALVHMTFANGQSGFSGSNVLEGNKTSSSRRDTILSMRFSNTLSRHSVITGSGHFFVPADGSGSLIQGATHVNVVSGTSVLNANAVLVTVVTNMVFAVSGDRQAN